MSLCVTISSEGPLESPVEVILSSNNAGLLFEGEVVVIIRGRDLARQDSIRWGRGDVQLLPQNFCIINCLVCDPLSEILVDYYVKTAEKKGNVHAYIDTSPLNQIEPC